jgi:DNA primase
MKKSISVDQNKIKIVCDGLCDRIEELLDSFGLEYRPNPKFVSMSCPIHGGDNIGALNLYHIGDSYRGNWKCRTHQCEEVFKGSIIGFIRGVLSHQKYNWRKNGDSTCSFQEALEYATNFLNVDIKNIRVSNTQKEKTRFVSNATILATNNNQKKRGISRGVIRKNLVIPSPYFISRGFDPAILDRYDVGDCKSENKEMSGRAVVPIYDSEYQYMVGCSGRTTSNDIKPKWRHSSDFKAEENLYNFWFAKDIIQKTNDIIIVESPGNVWKLEENSIHNAVATFGAHLTDKQKMILDTSGAMRLIVIMDSDDAGEKAREQIEKKCSRTYNIQHIRLSKNDIADMTPEEINQEIKAKI